MGCSAHLPVLAVPRKNLHDSPLDIKGKGNPSPWWSGCSTKRAIMRSLGLTSDECIVFEDAESGVQAAHAARMKCIGVGETAHLPSAKICITDYASVMLPNLTK